MIIDYDFDHDIDTVYQTITDIDFLLERALELGSDSAEAEIETDGDQTTIILSRSRQIKVPKLIRGLINKQQNAKNTEVWRAKDGGGYISDSRADVDGIPINIAGIVTLSSIKRSTKRSTKCSVKSATACHYKADINVSVRTRIAANTIKKYATKLIAKEIALECHYVAKYLT